MELSLAQVDWQSMLLYNPSAIDFYYAFLTTVQDIIAQCVPLRCRPAYKLNLPNKKPQPRNLRSCKNNKRIHVGGAENAGEENAGVDSRGGKCRSGKSRSDNIWKAVRKLLSHQECRLKRSGLKQFLNNAHEQRPGVHIQTSFLR